MMWSTHKKKLDPGQAGYKFLFVSYIFGSSSGSEGFGDFGDSAASRTSASDSRTSGSASAMGQEEGLYGAAQASCGGVPIFYAMIVMLCIVVHGDWSRFEFL
jgi:hypothetical protein